MREKEVICNAHSGEDEFVLKVRNSLPAEETIEDLSGIFKVFGDSTRLRILFALMDREMCVYHIAQSLEMTQSAISHQLRVLRENDLVKSRREGKHIFYTLDDDHVESITRQALEHIEHKKAEKQEE